MIRRLLYAALLFLAASLPANAALRAWVDNTQIAPGDTVQLTLAHDGQTNTRPDLAPLRQDFDIVGSSTSTNLQIINGNTSSTTELDLSLAPKHAGRLTVPALTWDSDRSAPLTLDVTAAAGGSNSGAGNAATASRVFLETEVSPKSPYVQAAVQVTVRVYTAVPLSHADLEFPDTGAALVRQTGSDGTSTSEKNGQSYQVVTRHYLVFPQHSGQVSIPGPTLSAAIPDRSRGMGLGFSNPFSSFFANSPFSGMLTTTKPIRLHGDPIVLDVQPRPANVATPYWLPAGNVGLQADWTPPQLQAHVGDPVTVDLHLRAEGLTAAQLPDLSALLSLPPGLKAYPDQPKLKDTTQGDGIVGNRDQSIAVIADEPGQFTIPELRVSWWDTRTNQIREAILPARILAVQSVPGSGGSVRSPAQPPQQVSGAPVSADRDVTPSAAIPAGGTRTARAAIASKGIPWHWLSLGLGLLWIATLIAWIGTNKRRGSGATRTPREGQLPERGKSNARAAFHAACRANDGLAARRNLLLWAAAEWPGPRIRGLNALAKLIDDPQVTRLLHALDRACYGGDSWDGAALAGTLTALPTRKRGATGSAGELAPLYR